MRPAEQFLEDVAIVGRRGRAERPPTSGRDAWRSGVVDWVGAPNPGGRAGGKGKLSVSPISGASRPGGNGRLATGGIAGANEDGGNASRLGSGIGAGETRERGFEARDLPRQARGERPTSVEPAHWRRWRCRRRVSRPPALCGRHRGQPRKDRFGNRRAEPVQRPDANRPGEGQGSRAGNNFRKNPLRSVPALKRKVVECSLDPLHP